MLVLWCRTWPEFFLCCSLGNRTTRPERGFSTASGMNTTSARPANTTLACSLEVARTGETGRGSGGNNGLLNIYYFFSPGPAHNSLSQGDARGSSPKPALWASARCVALCLYGSHMSTIKLRLYDLSSVNRYHDIGFCNTDITEAYSMKMSL